MLSLLQTRRRGRIRSSIESLAMAISSILPTTISLPTNPPAPISSLRVLSPSTTHLAFSSSPSPLLLLLRRGGGGGHGGAVAAPVRMGGGPRTFPGGVSKWQWKRMQAKKGKQLLKARLCRERQIYEMRKRAELRAAAAQLERPWEAPAPAPAPGTAERLLSVSADEQVKALADRFRRPGAFDAWNDRDGPQIFRKLPPTDDDDDNDDGNLPSARFFPKGAVHSVKPYGITNSKEEDTEVDLHKGGDDLGFGTGGRQRMRRRRRVRSSGEPPIDVEVTDSTRERTSSRLDSDDDASSRNGGQMRSRIDGRVNTNSRRRSYLRPTADLSNLSIDEDSNRKSDRRWSRYSGSNDRIIRGRIGDL